MRLAGRAHQRPPTVAPSIRGGSIFHATAENDLSSRRSKFNNGIGRTRRRRDGCRFRHRADVCQRVAEEGATVIGVERTLGSLAGRADVTMPLGADVSAAEEVDAALERIRDAYGRLDVLAHIAGVDDPIAKSAIAAHLTEGNLLNITSSLTEIVIPAESAAWSPSPGAAVAFLMMLTCVYSAIASIPLRASRTAMPRRRSHSRSSGWS
ncbi:SDR family NAD(P)-dependent oxidoreductase [Nocardia jiangxiensis]|uniref:SDR family NAD(P)-dependent oxidoreductase n=1 Tax=Nocardia jiangxiensis TaxID=282685 RepID=A0ABW6SBZ4_9NOCA